MQMEEKNNKYDYKTVIIVLFKNLIVARLEIISFIYYFTEFVFVYFKNKESFCVGPN